VIGCGCIAFDTLASLYIGLALFLTGSGLNVTCINMMLTQRFTPEDPRREGAFLWNYAGMNVGFFVGFPQSPPNLPAVSAVLPRQKPTSLPCLAETTFSCYKL